MAAPAEKTIHDLNGTWTMNKQLSDQTDPILQLQGIGWIIRKAIGMMTVTLVTKQYKDDEGVVHIDIEQPGAAGIKGTTELRQLDGTWREHEDHVFGAVKGHTKWIKIADLKDNDADEAYLKKGWAQETLDDEAIDAYVESVGNGWTARQIWGFEDVDVGGKKERRFVRHVVVKK
ncbi:hypothetical protein EJ08DRAFT_602467, partial [Tothia fuscella]